MKPQKSASRDIRHFFGRAPKPAEAKPQNEDVAPDTGNASTPPPLTTTLVTARSPPVPTPTANVPPAATSSTNVEPLHALPPTASQVSANSGASKRVVSSGQEVVLNSDSDTDSLPDLDFGFASTTIKTTPTASINLSKRPAGDDNGGDTLRRPQKKGRSKKLDLAMSAIGNIALEQEILNYKAELLESPEEPQDVKLTLTEDVLAQAVNDDEDPDKARRLFVAMQRASAGQTEDVFHFFHEDKVSRPASSPFPAGSLPQYRWTSSFREPCSRDQAFLSGFAQQIFRMQELPEEVASWMLNQIYTTQHESLHLKYLDILEDHDEYLHDLLDMDRLSVIFRGLGVREEDANFEDRTGTTPIARETIAVCSLPLSLSSILRLLKRASPFLQTKLRSYALRMLCQTCMDDRIIASSSILGLVQDSIEAILCHFASTEKLVKGLRVLLPSLVSRIDDPILQRDLVCALPIRSPLTAYFQRYLALSFLLYPKPLDISLADAKLASLLRHHIINSPHFRVQKTTDYGALTARLALLDIAVGPGPLSVPYQPLISPPASNPGSSSLIAPVPVSSEINDFNAEVDTLTQRIKMLGNSIVEASASVDLAVLDAKDCIERLTARLEHAVRIGGKKSHNVFGNDDENRQLKVTDIFRKVAKSVAAEPSQGIFDEDNGSDQFEDAVAEQINAERTKAMK